MDQDDAGTRQNRPERNRLEQHDGVRWVDGGTTASADAIDRRRRVLTVLGEYDRPISVGELTDRLFSTTGSSDARAPSRETIHQSLYRCDLQVLDACGAVVFDADAGLVCRRDRLPDEFDESLAPPPERTPRDVSWGWLYAAVVLGAFVVFTVVESGGAQYDAVPPEPVLAVVVCGVSILAAVQRWYR